MLSKLPYIASGLLTGLVVGALFTTTNPPNVPHNHDDVGAAHYVYGIKLGTISRDYGSGLVIFKPCFDGDDAIVMDSKLIPTTEDCGSLPR